ncbi:MAG: hypothetical protein ACIAXF_03825 [Phycisphaerales bacterium JB063]
MKHNCLILLVVALVYIAGCEDKNSVTSSGPSPHITPEDVAWATGWQITKFDLADAGDCYGVKMVVVDDQGNIVEEMGGLGGFAEANISPDKTTVSVAVLREGSRLQGKLRIAGASTTFEFNDTFDPKQWFWLGEPQKHGDLFYLGGDSSSHGVAGNQPAFEAGSHQLALRIIRTEEEFYE